MNKLKIILDTDPGGDDTFALLWLLSLVKKNFCELVAVTTVDGNVHAQYTYVSACKVLKLVGFEDIPVARGVIGGSQTHDQDAAFIHGADGMGNLSYILPEISQDYDTAPLADDLLIETLSAYPNEVIIIAIAPLTNLAAAEKKSPGILKLAKEIIIMGGAYDVPGNITPEAEFNIAYDVEAAKLVFESSYDFVILPLDVTRKLIFTPQMAQQVVKAQPNNKIAQFIVHLCDFMVETALKHRATKGKEGFLVHDAVTLAYLFYPETLRFRRAKVWVETQGEWTKGKTLFDKRSKTKVGANAWVALEVDGDHLLASLVEDLKSLIEC